MTKLQIIFNIKYSILNLSVIALIFYFLLSLFLYSPTLGSFFVSDDFDWVYRAKNIPLTWSGYLLSNADGHQDGGVYRPLTSASFWLNYQINKLSPVGYHLVNVVFHGLNAFLVFWLVMAISRWFASSGKVETRQCLVSTSFLAGLFFLVLPNHPEAVSWLSGRGDVLATFFYLLSLISYFYFRKRTKIVFLFLSLLAFALALGAKEMAITLPLVIVALELLNRLRRGASRMILSFLPFFILLLGYFLLRYQATGLFLGYYGSADLSFSWLAMKDNLLRSFTCNFLVGAPRQFVSGFFVGHWILFGLFLSVVCLLWFRFWKKERRLCSFAALFFSLTLLPVLNLSLSRLTDEGERLAYLPSVGIAILLSIIISNIFNIPASLAGGQYLSISRKNLLFFLIIIFLGGYFSFSLFHKNLNWQKAGQLSRALLSDFQVKTGLSEKQGVVILGLPDNLDGAYVWRNGWLNGLALFYPDYSPDVLVAKVGLNLSAENFNRKTADWTRLADGYRGASRVGSRLFSGPERLVSLDYWLEIKNYDIINKAGEQAEIRFTPAFLKQLAGKRIEFLAVAGESFERLDLTAK